ncbi:MAG: hypothetical protein ONB44_07635 [candidate division KSB1 bacterium]|nr:hypothetical protein [candidate division KSB1 bacterium]MDZ7301998.1 hypothetical protein [candidate division KSB1 bacterium]MDZ7310180.1 hypothetical protein [candidate division KSB1 bacterium]
MIYLKQTLSSLFAEAPSQLCVRDFVAFCRKIAVVYLRMKVKNGRLDPAVFGVSLEDLALDCIADLFKRDQQGGFARLAGYFNACEWENKSDDELLAATRRLIFSKVNQEICRLQQERDPALGKLIRNLKNAVKLSSNVRIEKQEGEVWICLPQENASTERLPVMPPEFLEAHLTAGLRDHADLKQVLMLLAEILQNQKTYRKSLPLTGLASIIRSAFTHLHAALEHEGNGHETFTPEDLEKIIDVSVQTIKSNMHSSYVGRKKIDGSTYESYFMAARNVLVAEYVENDGLDRSFYDYLSACRQGLTREAYQTHHRCRFEYLVKLVRTEFLRNLKKEL